MATYSHNFGSTFPEKLIVPGTHKDVSDADVEYVTTYNALIDAKNMLAASKYYEEHKDILEPISITMKWCNRIEEEILNVGRAALSVYNVLQSSSEPDYTIQDEGSYWIREY